MDYGEVLKQMRNSGYTNEIVLSTYRKIIVDIGFNNPSDEKYVEIAFQKFLESSKEKTKSIAFTDGITLLNELINALNKLIDISN